MMALRDTAVGHGRDAGSSGCRRCRVSRQRVGKALLYCARDGITDPTSLLSLSAGLTAVRTEAGSAAPARREAAGARHPPGA